MGGTSKKGEQNPNIIKEPVQVRPPGGHGDERMNHKHRDEKSEGENNQTDMKKKCSSRGKAVVAQEGKRKRFGGRTRGKKWR